MTDHPRVTDRKPWRGIFGLLERDERLFAVLLAVVMVGGLASVGLVPLRPRYRFDLYSLVFWFGAYKLGVFALVTLNPRATRGIFSAALAVDLLLIFGLMYLTGGGDSPFVNLFYPLVAVNAYYFGRWMGLLLTAVMGMLYWTAVVTLMGQVGLPAFALGHVADRERRARADVERLNDEITGTLGRLQTAQEELLVAERMATVGRLSLRVAHEVRNPIAAIELNAEILQDILRGENAADKDEAVSLVSAIRDQVNALDALTEEYLAFARFPKPHFEEESINHLLEELADFVRPVATRQGLALKVDVDPDVPLMEIDRTLLRQAILNLVKNGQEALSRGGSLILTSRLVGEQAEIAVSDTGPGISQEVGERLFEPFFTTKPQGTGLGLSIARQITDEHAGELAWSKRPGGGTTFTIRLPVKRAVRV